jgi:aspartate oxidase
MAKSKKQLAKIATAKKDAVKEKPKDKKTNVASKVHDTKLKTKPILKEKAALEKAKKEVRKAKKELKKAKKEFKKAKKAGKKEAATAEAAPETK